MLYRVIVTAVLAHHHLHAVCSSPYKYLNSDTAFISGLIYEGVGGVGRGSQLKTESNPCAESFSDTFQTLLSSLHLDSVKVLSLFEFRMSQCEADDSWQCHHWSGQEMSSSVNISSMIGDFFCV